MDEGLLVSALGWLYGRVAADLSVSVPFGASDREIDGWVRLACGQAGASGFVTNLGGVLTLPAALPANLVGTAAVQMRLIAKIAAARGYDTGSEQVKLFVFACLLGNAAVDMMKAAGLRAGARVAPAVLERFGRTLAARLLARFAGQGAASAAKVVPIVGGLIGGGLDAVSTRMVGAVAKRVFVAKPPMPPPSPTEPEPVLLGGPEAVA